MNLESCINYLHLFLNFVFTKVLAKEGIMGDLPMSKNTIKERCVAILI